MVKPATVEEIDTLLHGLAARCNFSSLAVQKGPSASRKDLEIFYRRLSSSEAKWFTRLILKSYGVGNLEPRYVYQTYDQRLPGILQIQDDFKHAIQSLRRLRKTSHLHIEDVLKTIKPALGIKVGRQNWLKGRSIKNCVDMSSSRVSCEKKMDGEYCQIHISITKHGASIQIFSKSGKDSTKDRIGLHGYTASTLSSGYADLG